VTTYTTIQQSSIMWSATTHDATTVNHSLYHQLCVLQLSTTQYHINISTLPVVVS